MTRSYSLGLLFLWAPEYLTETPVRFKGLGFIEIVKGLTANKF